MKNVIHVDLKYSNKDLKDLKQDPIKINNQGNNLPHIAFVHNPKARHLHSQSADQQLLSNAEGKININKSDSQKHLQIKNDKNESELTKVNLNSPNTPSKHNSYYDYQNNKISIKLSNKYESPKNKKNENNYAEHEEHLSLEESKTYTIPPKTQFSNHQNKIKSKLMDSTILELSNSAGKIKGRSPGNQSSMNTINSSSTNIKSPKNSGNSLIFCSPYNNAKMSPKASGLNLTNLTNLQLYKFQKTQPIHKGKLMLNHQKRIKHNTHDNNTYSFLNSYSNQNNSKSTLTIASDINRNNLNSLTSSQEQQLPFSINFSNKHPSSVLLTAQKEPLLKNRDRIIIRNKRLSLEKEIELPTINYKVNRKLKAPEMWQRGQEIKMQYETNLDKHLNFKKTYGHYLSSDHSKKDTNALNTERTVRTKLTRNSSFSVNNSLTEDSSIVKSTINEIDLQHSPQKRVTNPFVLACDLKERRISNINLNSPLDQPNTKRDSVHEPSPIINNFNFNLTSSENIHKELEKIRNSQFTHKYDFLNALHRKVENSHKRKSVEYKKVKNVYSQYKQKKILAKFDYAVSSNLFIMNQNPMFQINSDIAFPVYLNDPKILGNVYDVNMHNLRSLTEKYVQREKELLREMGIVETENHELINTMKVLDSIKKLSFS